MKDTAGIPLESMGRYNKINVFVTEYPSWYEHNFMTIIIFSILEIYLYEISSELTY